MAPTFRHGKSASFFFNSVNWSSGISECTLDRSIDTAETTTYGDSDKTYIPGLRDGTFSVSGHFASTYEGVIQALLGTTGKAFIYSPESTASGRRKLTGSGILTKYSVGAPVGDKVSMSVDIQCTGAITSTTWS